MPGVRPVFDSSPQGMTGNSLTMTFRMHNGKRPQDCAGVEKLSRDSA